MLTVIAQYVVYLLLMYLGLSFAVYKVFTPYYKYWYYKRQGINTMGGFPLPLLGGLLSFQMYWLNPKKFQRSNELVDYFYQWTAGTKGIEPSDPTN